jgi:hypothetical protein
MSADTDRVQLATYPQSPFPGPVRCCDVADLYQAFSQRTGPGVIMDKSGRRLVAFGEKEKRPKHFQLQLNIKNNPLHPLRDTLNAFCRT